VAPSRLGELGNAGEAAGGGVAVLLVAQRLLGRVGGIFRSSACREVGALRLELKPTLEALTAEANASRTWREEAAGELGYLRGAVDALLDGHKPAPARRTRR